MKVAISFLVFILLSSFTFSSVVELTPEQILEIGLDNTDDVWFIKFYGPNCGFCKAMAEEWESFAQLVEEEELDIKIGQFDVHKTENQVQEIRTFFPGPLPGLHLFPPGDKKFYEFPNPRINVDKEFYLNFALFDFEQASGIYRKPEYIYEEENAIVSIPGEEFDSYLEKADKPYFVMFFGPKCGWCKQLMPLWEQFAEESIERQEKWTVARMDGFTKMQIIERYSARPWPSLVFIDNGKYYRWDTELVREISSTDEMREWINSGEYLEVDDDHKGTDEGYERYLKVKEAKEKSKQRKKEKQAKEEL